MPSCTICLIMAAATLTQAPAEAAGRHSSSYGIGHFIPPEQDLALADLLANAPSRMREEILDGIPLESLLTSFDFWGRPSQLDALLATNPIVACLAGRGWGKTRTLSEWVIKKARDNPGSRGALIGRSTPDVRDVLIMGESGILACSPPDFMP